LVWILLVGRRFPKLHVWDFATNAAAPQFQTHSHNHAERCDEQTLEIRATADPATTPYYGLCQ
jgi:hypothetical protein